jgi:hypothetical protein
MIFSFLLLALSINAFVPTYLRADCCNSEIRNCCDHDCLSFKKTAQYFCYLKAQDLQALNTGYINNTTIGNLHVLTNDTADGTLTADNIFVDGDVNVNGAITLDGEAPEISISQYGYFTRTALQNVANLGIIAFNVTNVANGITNAAGVITFSESGFYLINFTAAINNAGQSNFRLVFDPAGAQTPIPNTQFLSFNSFGDGQLTGLVIVEVPTAGTSIGVQNISGGPRTIDLVDGLPNTIASIQIVKLGDL